MMSVPASSTTRDKWMKEFNEKGQTFKFMSDGKSVFCLSCEKAIEVTQKSQLSQHLKATVHVRNSELKQKRRYSQAQLEDVCSSKAKKSKTDILGKELCEAMLSANIPWIKLQNVKLRDFLEKNIGIKLPDETTIRKVHLNECYEEVKNEIQTSLKDCSIWIGVDETTDACGRYVANVLIGKLESEKYNPPFLVNCSFLDKTDSSTISRLINDTLRQFWPDFNASHFKLLVTDAAANMLKSGKDLKVFYPEMIHVTCLAHGIHRVCETIRGLFGEVNEIISLVKKVFLKSPSRVLVWKETCNLSLPPEPILTRWGTWLEAAIFYAQHLESIKSVLSKLDSNDSIFIEKAQERVENTKLKTDLAFIHAHFAFLPLYLKQIETAGLSLSSAFSILTDTEASLNEIPGVFGVQLKEKFSQVLKRNPDIEVLRAVKDILQGGEGETHLSPVDIAHFKFAPVANVDVERSFSIYKNVLDDRRQCLTKENLTKIMVTNMFYQRA
jgi:hypothetical protein